MQNSVLSYVLTVVVSILSFSPAISAQEMPTTTGNSASASSVPPFALTSKVDELFERFDKKDSPGCAVGISQNGKLTYSKGYGVANLTDATPITPGTTFDIASVSKQFTAASIVLLAQDGKLSFDDDIRKYLPEMPKYDAPVTIRHLIHHESGLRDYATLMSFLGEPNVTRKEMYKIITQQKGLNVKTGEEHLYSNTNYFLLAEIVQRVSGKSLPDFAAERIFEPLSMKNTHFYREGKVIKNRSQGYGRQNNEFKLARPTSVTSVGASGVWTTVEDLALWEENFYTGKVGGEKFIKQMLTPGKLKNGQDLTYAFGIGVSEYKGLTLINHTGWIPSAFAADFRFYPEHKFGVYALCNDSTAAPGSLTRQIADLYLADKFKPAQISIANSTAVNLTEQELQAMAGNYYDELSDTPFRLFMKDGKLTVDSGPGIPVTLTGKNQFSVMGMAFYTIIPGSGKTPATLQEVMGKNHPVKYKVVEAPTTLTPENMAEYAGTYCNHDINAVLEVGVKGNSLYIKLLNGDEGDITPAFKDSFSNKAQGWKNIMFIRNKRNRVVALSFSTGRGVRKMPFEKVVK